jgi:MFS family permease
MTVARQKLLTPDFAALLLIAYVSFAQYHVLQAVLPVLVITQGGDVTIAGVVVAMHSLPSILFRPPFGWLIDRVGIGIVLLVAGGLLAVSGFAYFLPGIGLLLLARFAHGTAWSGFSAAGHSALVALSPPYRRAEAAGFYNLMAGMAQSTMPAAAFALIGISGFFGGLALSAACGVVASIFVVVLVRRALGLKRPAHHSGGLAAASRPLRRRIGEVLMEPAALRPLAIEIAYSAIQPLFLAFAPVYALANGLPLELMPIYFLAYGATLIAARLILGSHSDRRGRLMLIRSGVVLSLVALASPVLWPGFGGLILGGMLFAVATTLVSPTTMALTMDLAPPGRMGSAMATYTLGFPLATGGSAAIWGAIIQQAGYPAPFLVGAGLHLALLAVLVIAGPRLLRSVGSPPSGATPA